MKRGALISATVVALAFLAVGCSSSKSSTPAPTTAAGGGVTVPAAGTPVAIEATDQSETAQSFKFDKTSVAAGKVTFTFKNSGTRKHEMVVLKTDEVFDALKVGADNKVSEDTSKGEIGETDAGKTGTVTIDLTPGKYVIVCNIEKHYAQGMRTAFTVTG